MSADDRSTFFLGSGLVRRSWPFLAVLALGLLAPRLTAAEGTAEDPDGDPDEAETVTVLEAFSVKADRVEDFGLRVVPRYDRSRSMMLWPVRTPIITAIVPNTAASKAGLKPGERIVRSDGQSTTSSVFSTSKWRRLQQKKWAEVTAGKKSVTWTLEVEAVGSTETRTVKLIVPTAPPRWGATTWQKPEGRTPAVTEPGPLAEFARNVLDNGLWQVDWGNANLLGFARADENKFLGYGWSLGNLEIGEHRVLVSQQRGRTDVIFVSRTKEHGTSTFFTSPSGALEKTWGRPLRGKWGELPLEEGRIAFQAEMDFWLTRVGKVTGRWPFELIPDKTTSGAGLVASAEKTGAKAQASGPRAVSFLKLASASEEQRALFKEAFGKIGTDEDRWAYTETSHGLDDKRVATMRVDPSRPEAERYTLLKLNGKPPTAEEVKRWRDEGRDASASLGELPPISNLVDLEDVRVVAEERAAVVFELPLRASNPQFPADKFQALFRVNKTQRAFEDIVVKLREAVRVAGIVSISEAGMEVRFQTFDPRYAPQPVWLKAGGAVRLLLVKISRSFEATRTDFKRVEPYVERAAPELELPPPVLLR